jgi:hypothetical protein
MFQNGVCFASFILAGVTHDCTLVFKLLLSQVLTTRSIIFIRSKFLNHHATVFFIFVAEG